MKCLWLVIFAVLLAMPISFAKITEINTTCGLFDCVSYFESDNDLSSIQESKAVISSVDYINTSKEAVKYSYGDFLVEKGNLKNVNIEIAKNNIIKISGNIDGASSNLWGFSILGDDSHLHSTWWNSSWQYNQQINISNTYGNLVNYPINISFSSANVNYSKMLSSGCDLRFTDNLSNLLNHYIETWNASGTSSVWVNVSSILNNTITSVYMYYGNALATCNGNASKVFDIYDNFSTNNNNTLWNMTGNMYVNTTAGYLYSYGSETGWNITTLKSISTFSRKEWLIFYGKYYGGAYFSPRWQLSTTTTAGEWNPQATTMAASMLFYYQYYLTNVVWTCQQGGCVNNTVWSTDTWSEFKIILRNSGHQWYYRNLSMASWVNPLNTSNCTDTSLKIALAVYGGTTYWDDLRVYQQVPSGISYTFGTENMYINNYFVDTNSYATPTAEGISENYTLSITANQSISDINAWLIRNGTAYSPNIKNTAANGDNNEFTFIKNLVTPYMNISGSTYNVTLFWLFNVTFANSSIVNDSTPINNQTVIKTAITNCSAGSLSTTVAINFTFYDEKIVTNKVLSNMNIAFDLLDINGNQLNNLGFNVTNQTSATFCIYPTTSTLTANILAQYSSATYSQRDYIANGIQLSSTVQYVSLYLLNNLSSTLVTINARNDVGLTLSNAIIQVQKFYPETNTFRGVAMGLTSQEGKAFVYLEVPDPYYKILVFNGNTLIWTTPNQKLTSSGFIVTVQTSAQQIYSTWNQISYSCTKNTTSKIVSCVYSDASNLPALYNLTASQQGATLLTPVCSSTSAIASGTLMCDLSSLANGTYQYSFTAKYSGSSILVYSDSIDIGQVLRFGMSGVFLGFILFLTLAMIGIYSPIVSMLLGSTGLIAGAWLQIIPVSSASLVSLIFVVIIAMWKGKV